MELVIRESDGYDYGFSEFLAYEVIPKRIMSLIKRDKLKKWDNYFFKDSKLDINLGSLKSTESIIKFGADNLSITYLNGYMTIHIDSNAKIIGTDTKISTVCRLINYGNANISGYMIFSDAFNTVRKELKLYQTMYMMRNM